MTATVPAENSTPLRILAVPQGQWGTRIADNISRSCPADWDVHRWAAPRVLPPIIDDPDDFLPAALPAADLLIALGDTAGVAQLVPDIVRLCGAKSVIAPIDRNESLPPGLALQLQKWLAALGVKAVFPRPFCSLTETTYNRPPVMVEYDDPLVREFARCFGKPQFRVAVSPKGLVESVHVERDTACGCARAVAAGLVGCPLDQAEHEAGMLHHHYPCQASMNQDPDYCDTLMHVSGHTLREAIHDQIKDKLAPKPYFRPMGRVEDSASLA